MREIACALCGGTDRTVLYEGTVAALGRLTGPVDHRVAHYRINRCRKCGLAYASPILESQEIEALYIQAPHAWASGEDVNVRRTMQHYYSLALAFLHGRDRMLDIGCDTGLLLDVVRQDGFRELHGLEPNPVAARAAAAVPGAIISNAFFEVKDFPEAYFDFVSLIHVLDHLVNPVASLEKVRRHLKPGGVVLAVVHNVESLPARVLGERFPAYNLHHHCYFSPTTLHRLVEKSGFDVLRVVSTYNYYSLRFFVNRTPTIPRLVRRALRRFLDVTHLGTVRLAIRLGNIGIVARRSGVA